MSIAAETPMTVEAFLAWAEGLDGRWQLLDSRPIAMAPERAAHLLTKAQAWDALYRAVGRAGLPCTVFPDGATVRVSARTAFEPDALVTCDPRVPPDAIEIPNPLIVVEVLSEGAADPTFGAKLENYFSLPSVAHYLIVDPERRTLIHHRRGRGDVIETRILTAGPLPLEPPGLALAVEDFFVPP
ncbi:Uma2 family endonuclease [Roseiarcus fermentans]|uniref:Uma2 family endonuclease n=1 Tax=Roseiarcus fermentans TaxID=1473586 RepID=A0A366FGP3_9HYPH|nr:Uma2 family endonuclease [Roseiarcus fermentans]RBP13828.1 Uma2 family endonuclease [Roseiarcus fermentans]